MDEFIEIPLYEYVTYLLMLLPAAGGLITIGAFVGLSKAVANVESLILWDFSGLSVFFGQNAAYWKDYRRFCEMSEIRTDAEKSIYEAEAAEGHIGEYFTRQFNATEGHVKESHAGESNTAECHAKESLARKSCAIKSSIEEISAGKTSVRESVFPQNSPRKNPSSAGFSIEFRDVYFRYENMTADVLSGVSFVIRSEELCGLVGINGAGKSTLTKLMLGLYEPTAGEILINGKSTKQMSFEEQIGCFGVTYQDFSRYNISLFDNVALSGKNVSREKAQAVLQSLGFAWEKLPSGMDTVLGRSFGDGIDLSGGEWQKVAIARMLCTDAPMFIMDEPTASLDPVSEVELYQEIQAALSGKPSLLITHRLGATVLCDRILVLDGGKIAESGTFAELMERRGVYAQMYHEQKKWYSR